MAAESSKSIPSPDSYIGSLISLTSKSEIRYEGILYNINTEESSIGLRNVRSFGTEGRKKDGLYIPAGEKVYEYILFRGSDIKDLQVKPSPPVQTTPTHNDPAIIQSNYLHTPAATSSLPSNLHSLGTVAPELSSHSGQVGLQRPTFQGSPYPTGGNLGSWGPSPSPSTVNGSGVAVPMYWQGYYAPPGGFPHMQQSLLRPVSGLAMPSLQQNIQFQGLNTSLSSGAQSYPEFSPLFPPVISGMSLLSAPLPLTVAPIQTTSFAPEMSQSSVSNKGPASSLPSLASSGSLLPVPPLNLSMETITSLPQCIQSVVSSKPMIGSITSLGSTLGSSSSIHTEASANLVNPGQLMQTTPPILPSHPSEKTTKEVEIKPHEDKTIPLLSHLLAPDPKAKAKPPAVEKEPILPLPTPTYKKPNGSILVSHESSGGRGRGRGRGSGYLHPQTKFTEDFDFTAMNEKFNKDEVWGHLGKSISHTSSKDEYDDADGFEEDNAQFLKLCNRPVYVKDDFFDTLSSNTNNQTSNGRIKFSEQLKIDTETFGNFPRHRSTYGGGRGLRGGRGRGSYHGRGYGYPGRGRGYTGTSRAS